MGDDGAASPSSCDQRSSTPAAADALWWASWYKSRRRRYVLPPGGMQGGETLRRRVYGGVSAVRCEVPSAAALRRASDLVGAAGRSPCRAVAEAPFTGRWASRREWRVCSLRGSAIERVRSAV